MERGTKGERFLKKVDKNKIMAKISYPAK